MQHPRLPRDLFFMMQPPAARIQAGEPLWQ